MLQQRLDFAFENKIETIDRLAKMHGQKLLKHMLDLLFENKIETLDSLAKIQGQKIAETTVRFSIGKQD